MKSSGHRGRMQGFTSDVDPLQPWLFCLKQERLRTRNKFEPQVREHCDHEPHSVNPSVELEESPKGNIKEKGWFPYDRRRSRIAGRGSQIAKSSAIVCDHMETHFCDPAIVIADDRRRSQKIEPCCIFCDRLQSSAIVGDQLRSCDHMETKVLRSAIETYPIIFWIPTHDSTLLSNKATAYLL